MMTRWKGGADIAEFFVKVLVETDDANHGGIVGREYALGDKGLEAVATGVVLDGGTHTTVG